MRIARLVWGAGSCVALTAALGACGGGGGPDGSVSTVDNAAPSPAVLSSSPEAQLQTDYGCGDPVVVARAEEPGEPLAGANLIANPGFESLLANWTDWGNTTAVSDSSSGTYGVRVGSGAGGLGQDIAGILAGQKYTFSGQVKVSDASEAAYLGVKFMDASGTRLLEQVLPFRCSSSSYATGKVDVVAPADTATALVYLWKNDGAGFAHADNIALVPAGPSLAGSAGEGDWDY